MDISTNNKIDENFEIVFIFKKYLAVPTLQVYFSNI